MLWDVQEPIQYELLKARLNSEIYCCQIYDLNHTLKEKRPALINRKLIIQLTYCFGYSRQNRRARMGPSAGVFGADFA